MPGKLCILHMEAGMSKSYLDSLVGVFGHPVAENPTVVMIEAGFRAAGLDRWRYLTIDVPLEKLGQGMDAVRNLGFTGINLTIPHKVEVLQYLDDLSEAAEKIGAVNTVVNREGRLFGENTDGKGFLTGLREDAGIDPEGKRVLVFGAGGAARAICVELGLAGAGHITIVNRTGGKAKELAGRVRDETGAAADAAELKPDFFIPEKTEVVVQATSVGLYPDVDHRLDIDYGSLRPEMTICDVIPNPPATPFLAEAEKRGCTILDGLSMLVYQGVTGF